MFWGNLLTLIVSLLLFLWIDFFAWTDGLESILKLFPLGIQDIYVYTY